MGVGGCTDRGGITQADPALFLNNCKRPEAATYKSFFTPGDGFTARGTDKFLSVVAKDSDSSSSTSVLKVGEPNHLLL